MAGDALLLDTAKVILQTDGCQRSAFSPVEPHGSRAVVIPAQRTGVCIVGVHLTRSRRRREHLADAAIGLGIGAAIALAVYLAAPGLLAQWL